MNRRDFLKLLVTIVCFYLLIISTSVWAEQEPSCKRLIRLDDLYMTDTPYASILSPVDPQRAVFGRYWLDKATKTQRRSLWLAEGSSDNVRPLEEGEPDGHKAIFSPDGKWIAFLSTRPRPSGFKQTPQVPLYSEPAVDIWLIPATGGTAIPLAGPNKPYGLVFNDWIYHNVAFSPDGKRLVFAADDGKDPRTPEEIEADVYIVRLDKGEGYTGYGPSQIWVAYLDDEPKNFAASRIERLTNDEQWYGEPQWSPDGDTIVVHAFRNYNIESGPLFNQNYDLLAIDVESHSVRALTSGPGAELSPRFSPDGKRIAYLSVPRKGPHFDIFNIAIVSLNDGQPTTKVIFDHHGPGADNPPHPPAWYRLPGNCWLGPNHLIYKALMGTTSKTILLDLRTGKGMPLGDSGANTAVSSFLERKKQLKKLIPPGDLFLKQRLLGEVKVIRWDNKEGMEIEGIVTLPHPSAAKAPYKLIVFPHGGPHWRSREGFNFDNQFFAAHGYAVFEINFRGTLGYGRKFLDADRYDFGGGDMRDILTGIDFLIEQGIADAHRQFVKGISYGGYMTCWLVGHTNQFLAAVAENAVTDLNVMWGLSDIPNYTTYEFGGRPWEVPDIMRQRSPITYVAQVSTPTLIIHSENDRRCPIAMGKMFYKSLLTCGVETQMVIYPNEGHSMRQPRHHEDVLRRILAWFEKHNKK